MVVASAAPRLPLLDLAILFVLLAAALAALGRDPLERFRRGLWRLKWLFLAIAVLYWGFTPGTALWDAAPGLSREGLFEGSRRMLALAALLAAVYTLIAATPVPELAAALSMLMRPLDYLGFDADRFALRLALTLDRVAAAQNDLRQARAKHPASLVDAAAQALSDIETHAKTGTAQVDVPRLSRPPWWQWSLPVFAFFVFSRLAS